LVTRVSNGVSARKAGVGCALAADRPPRYVNSGGGADLAS
jgi:hypothetical protein